jgi:hypothetical protein
MARKNVITATMFKYRRSAPKGEFLGWGYEAVRKARTVATSPRLLSYRSCIAGELSGKKPGTLKGIQEAFKAAAKKCAEQAKTKPTKPKKKRLD